MTNKVFITGCGALSASGLTANDTWDALTNGRSGIAPINNWDIGNWPCSLAGELKGFNAAKMLPDRKLSKVISTQDAIGICAAVQAVEHSQMIAYRDTLSSQDLFNEETAVYVGSPGNKYFQQYDFLPLLAKTQGNMGEFAAQLFDEVHPMWLLRILPNNVLAYTGITYGFKGPNHNIVNHAVSGVQALLEAYHAIATGTAKRAVVVAYDVPVEPQALFYYEQLGVLSNDAIKPFDEAHNGTIFGDGAAAIVLESEESASMRQATRYARILGGLAATEAHGLFSIEPEGEHLASLLQNTLTQTHLSASDIGLIVAHGNGNIKSDNSEALAIQRVFEGHHVPVSAFKWSMGHTVCASGLLDTVLATYALNNQCAPGIANLEQKAPDCLNLCVSKERQQLTNNKALVINRGFGGLNASVVLEACE